MAETPSAPRPSLWGMDKPRQYRKLPVVITAQQFDSDKAHRLVGEFAAAICRKPHDGFAYTELPPDPRRVGSPHIHTLEGPLGVSDRDWIVKGIKGEFYAVKPDVFDGSYEAVE